ncbi:MAG TPA: DUF1559 domain-containing protein, partial [Pirellulales bacterium]|nr:DUF1559 domain-containing protein [Pirellulales bacterium]
MKLNINSNGHTGRTRNGIRTTRHCRGFTLVELLVVIAIIGVLIGMLLPAINSARESARRARCSNNLKQMGLALITYNNIEGALPVGAYGRGTTDPLSAGTNWKTLILPYMEAEKILFDQLFDRQTNRESGLFAAPWTDNEVLDGLVFAIYKCPSSSFDAIGTLDNGTAASYAGGMGHEYAGISGAYPDPNGRTTTVCNQTQNGWFCRNGMLRVNESRNLANNPDGNSNTLLAVEQSGHVELGGQRLPIRANFVGGWGGAWEEDTRANQVTMSDDASFVGVTTVMFPLNSPSATVGFSDTSEGNNTILNSSHPGTVQGLLADGSVQTLSDGL